MARNGDEDEDLASTEDDHDGALVASLVGFIDRGIAAGAVDFGGVGAESFTVVSNNTIDATAPLGMGTVDVTVTTNAGMSSADPTVDSFYYLSSYSS